LNRTSQREKCHIGMAQKDARVLFRTSASHSIYVKERHNLDQAAIIAHIDRLEYDFHQFELHAFIDHVARYQRREILLQAFPLQLTLSAAWVRGDEVDYI